VSRWEDAGATGPWVDERSVSPVIATVLMVAIVLVIAASIGAVGFGFADRLGSTTVAPGEGQCVVQSVEFNPENIDSFADRPYDCVVWFDASQDEYSDGDTVQRWRDRSGNGFDATSVDDSDDPDDVDDPIYTSVDGVSAIEFGDVGPGDGSGLSTDITSGLRDIEDDTQISVMAMVRFEPNAGTIFQAGSPPGSPVDYFRFGYYEDPTQPDWFATSGDGFFGHEPDGVDGQWNVVTYVHNGSAVTAYVNGQRKGSLAGELDISDDPLRLGHEDTAYGVYGDYYDGYIAELAVFETDLVDDERQAMECAMNAKYGDSVEVAGC